ncbi:MAG TPA: alpha/beta hydrolase [Agriterribacter sp.]|nr:alpha/beta hydrolase [Agriterribacter sp.]
MQLSTFEAPVFLIAVAFVFTTIPSEAQENLTVIPLWQNGAPGFESRKNEKEEAKDWWVKHISNPSVTVFLPPKNKATGAAVIICPGGGHRNLVYNAEGVEPAKYLNSIGVTAFVLKYRLFREENSGYTEEDAKQDIFRAMRVVRSMAGEFKIDTARIGVMGFSAGGEMAGWVSYHFLENHVIKPDEVDLLSARPAFQVLIYPGPLAVPDMVSPSSPATFLVAANDDACCSEPVVQLLQMHRKAKVPVEVHLYAQGDHAFNMGYRSSLQSIKAWPQRLADWLTDMGIARLQENHDVR